MPGFHPSLGTSFVSIFPSSGTAPARVRETGAPGPETVVVAAAVVDGTVQDGGQGTENVLEDSKFKAKIRPICPFTPLSSSFQSHPSWPCDKNG